MGQRSALAIELRQERARLMLEQHRLAATINSYYPRAAGGSRPVGEVMACAQATANTARIREIDADLTALAANEGVG
jgi:hypothetical protein